jgi:hypothetical protein
MGFLVPHNADLVVGSDPDTKYELDRYVKQHGCHGYLKRYVVEDSHKVIGAEYLEIRQLNFANLNFVPGPLCRIQTIPGRKPYVAALMEHPHALHLAQHALAYNVPVVQYWQRYRARRIPDLAVVYGSAAIGFFSPEEADADTDE